MEKAAFFDIRADIPKNRLYVILEGYFGDQDSLLGMEKAIAEVKKYLTLQNQIEKVIFVAFDEENFLLYRNKLNQWLSLQKNLAIIWN